MASVTNLKGFKIDKNGAITGYSGSERELTVESSESVRSIGDGAFKGCDFTSFRMFTSIGGIITVGVKKIGKSAFENSTSLINVTFPDALNYIGDKAFKGCTALKRVNLTPAMKRATPRLKSIEFQAFKDCVSLETVRLSQSVETLCWGVFDGCSSLTEIELSQALKTIGGEAFKGCSSLEKIALPASLELIGKEAFRSTGVKRVVIPAAVKEIREMPFAECNALSEIEFESPLGWIDSAGEPVDLRDPKKNADLLKRLSEVITHTESAAERYEHGACPECGKQVPVSSNRIKTQCKHCGAIFETALAMNILESIEEAEETERKGERVTPISDFTVETVEDDDDYGWGGTKHKRIRYIGEDSYVAIPAGIDVISKGMFEGCDFVKEITVSSGVKKIEDSAFEGCSVEAVYVLPGVEQIGKMAFKNCASLESVELPSTVSEIGAQVFYGCTSLRSITVTSGNPKYRAESGCLMETVDSKFSISDRGKMRVIAAAKDFRIPNDGSVTRIGEKAFADRTDIEEIVIPSSVLYISDRAFSGCSELRKVEFEAGCQFETVSDSLFEGCTKLEEIALPDRVSFIGVRAFAGCVSLKSVRVGSKLWLLKRSCFENCTSLTEITLPTAMWCIEEHPFIGCDSLKNVNMGATRGWKAEKALFGTSFANPEKTANILKSSKKEFKRKKH